MRDQMTTAVRTQRTIATALALAASFCAWVALLVIFPLPGSASAGAATGNPESGKELFEKRCGGCHSLDHDKEGPRLRNVYGRRAGSVSSFKYSDALKSAQITWDGTLLDKWLTDTESVIPDNDMTFHVPKTDERADIIQFLRVSSAQ